MAAITVGNGFDWDTEMPYLTIRLTTAGFAAFFGAFIAYQQNLCSCSSCTGVSSKDYCTDAYAFLIIAALFLVFLHLCSRKYIFDSRNIFKDTLGWAFPLSKSMYYATLLLLSNLFSFWTIECYYCIYICVLLAVSVLMYETCVLKSYFLALSTTFLSLTVSLSVTSYLKGDFTHWKLIFAWVFSVFIFVVQEYGKVVNLPYLQRLQRARDEFRRALDRLHRSFD